MRVVALIITGVIDRGFSRVCRRFALRRGDRRRRRRSSRSASGRGSRLVRPPAAAPFGHLRWNVHTTFSFIIVIVSPAMLPLFAPPFVYVNDIVLPWRV
jgi:hypothetical protein